MVEEEEVSDCGCSPEFRKPKPNGTCATCGGWLPGQREDTPWGRRGYTLTQMWAGEMPDEERPEIQMG